MKTILLKKSNLVIMAAIAAAIVAAILCFSPIDQGGHGDSVTGAGVAESLEAAALQNNEVPLSSGDDAYVQDGHEYESDQLVEEDITSPDGESAADPYANSYGQNGGGDTGIGGADIGGYEGSASGIGGSGGDGDSTVQAAGPTVTLYINASTAGRGDIMPARIVAITEGESVFDVLYRECRASGIHMASRWMPIYNSAYVEGIDNLYEFDNGELSGWMYSVNGWYPNYGCSQYSLKDGDVIAWRYTCDLGRDIGGSNVVG